MRFRPCIDLRHGRVVQIVGGTLRDDNELGAVTNFETERSSADYAKMYSDDGFLGGHVIALGPGNEAAALAALEAFPGGLHMGGGIRADNGEMFLDAGASHVIVTSYVFREGQVDVDRLNEMVKTVGKDRLVLDLSCRKRGEDFVVVTDRWQKFTDVVVNEQTLQELEQYCSEFLVHGVEVEGKRAGIEETLVEMLGRWSSVPVTYAGGAKTLDDLDRVCALGQGRVDLTIGSALDIFGGDVAYRDVVAWQRENSRESRVTGHESPLSDSI
ncbi:MAG: phosphoribosylformimino-5-aminoimidazole carboxamide ribotide isomerase [Candidatus Latescibacteria bacterium]|jgi:phosphoribosylformimino-5-aminoimidazole carboxamide ribotide isomerase|nr:phosphoribosylformimino-5-aminoimidazole carboxamide ribotide isomerase [Candidatus Latescibacterota bacterium]